MNRKRLMDKQWDKVKGLVPGKATGGGVTAHDNRLFVDVVLWIARAGSPWRDLPSGFGKENENTADQAGGNNGRRHGRQNPQQAEVLRILISRSPLPQSRRGRSPRAMAARTGKRVNAGLGLPAKAFSLGRATPAILSDLCLKVNLL